MGQPLLDYVLSLQSETEQLVPSLHPEHFPAFDFLKNLQRDQAAYEKITTPIIILATTLYISFSSLTNFRLDI
jgi:hypothetical protein